MIATVSGSNLLCSEMMYPNGFMNGTNVPFIPVSNIISKINSVQFSSVGKFNGVSAGSISKANGVATQ